MKIAVVGSRGQLGTDCSRLLAEKHEVICCNRPQIDIADNTSVDSCIAMIRPDVVVNCAAYTAVDACEQERELCRQINTEGARHLAQAATKYGFRLIHLSTDYVFDGKLRPPKGYTETDCTNPLSEYGKSKLLGEQAVMQHAENKLILRTAWLYSQHGRNFLKTMLRLALQNPTRPLSVVNDQYGTLTWSRTLALQIEKLLDDTLQGVVHATSEGYCTWFEGACYFLDAMGVRHNLQPCTTKEYPTPAIRPANSILNNYRLDQSECSAFCNWQQDIKRFVKECGKALLEEQGKG